MPTPTDQLVARFAVQGGFTSEDRVRECLELQRRNRAIGYEQGLIAVLAQRGYLDPEQQGQLTRQLAYARFVLTERAFAKACVERGLVDAELARAALEEQQRGGYRFRLGDRWVESGALSGGDRDAIAGQVVQEQEEEERRAREADSEPAMAPLPELPPQPPRVGAGALDSLDADRRRFSSSDTWQTFAVEPGAIEGLTLGDRLGQGRLGVVYRALEDAGGEVAVKILSPTLTGRPEFLDAFRQAWQRAQPLEHAGLARLDALGATDAWIYFSSAYVEGESLAVRVERGGPLEDAEARRLVEQLTATLGFVHGRGVVHGGLTPKNVLCAADGRYVLTDVGISGAHLPSGSLRAGYASPQVLAGRPPAAADDVYALGCVLYYALVGRAPFPGEPGYRSGPAPDPRQANPQVSEELAGLVEAATLPDPAARAPSVQVLEARLHPPELPSAPPLPGAFTSPPGVPQPPKAPKAPSVPSPPSAPKAPSVHLVTPQAPTVPQAPAVPRAPTVPQPPTVPEAAQAKRPEAPRPPSGTQRRPSGTTPRPPSGTQRRPSGTTPRPAPPPPPPPPPPPSEEPTPATVAGAPSDPLALDPDAFTRTTKIEPPPRGSRETPIRMQRPPGFREAPTAKDRLDGEEQESFSPDGVTQVGPPSGLVETLPPPAPPGATDETRPPPPRRTGVADETRPPPPRETVPAGLPDEDSPLFKTQELDAVELPDRMFGSGERTEVFEAAEFDAEGPTIAPGVGFQPPAQLPTQLPAPPPKKPVLPGNLVGQVVDGRYEVTRQLGQGGMGTVYEAKHLKMGQRRVALKVLNPELSRRADTVGRFKREIMALGQIDHPSVVRLLDAGTDPLGRLYMAMEYVEGVVLSDVIAAQSPLPFARGARILEQLLEGVGAGHARHILHRDLKAENVLLTHPGTPEEGVKILDFGVAKLLESGEEQASSSGSDTSEVFHTMESVALGTPQYMSPEQAAGAAEIDLRSDIYSLGVMAYELFTGVLPFEAETPVGFIGKHIVDPPRSFSEAAPGVKLPPLVEPFVLKALMKEREERYQTTKEMLDALKVLSRPPGETAGSDEEEVSVASSADWEPGGSDPGFVLSGSEEAPAPLAGPADAEGEPHSARQASLRRHMTLRRIQLATLLMGLLVVVLGAGLGVRLAMRPRDPQQALDAARDQLQRDLAAGDLKSARALLEGLPAGDGRDAELQRLEGLTKLSQQASDLRARVAEARAQLDEALEGKAAGPAGKALKQLETALEELTPLRERLLKEGLDAAAGEPLELDLDAYRQRLKTLQEGDALGKLLEHARSLVDSDPYLARDALEKALSMADEARRPQVEEELRSVRQRILAREADQELKKAGVVDYAKAIDLLQQALKLGEDPDLRQRLERAQEEAQDTQRQRAQALVQGALERSQAALDQADFAGARAELESARKDLQELGSGDAAPLDERLQAVAAAEASYPDYQALPKLADDATAAALSAAIEARRAYLDAHPAGYQHAQLEAGQAALQQRLEARQAEEQRAGLQAKLDQAQTSLEAAAYEDAAQRARAVLEQAQGQGEDALAQSARELLARIEARQRLQAALAGFARVGDLYVSKTEVSNKQYAEFMFAALDAARGSGDAQALTQAEARFPSTWVENKDGDLPRIYPQGQGSWPVEGVRFEDAQAYCAWLSQRLGVTARLPTEAEWIQAATGGDASRRFPWGDASADAETRAQIRAARPLDVSEAIPGGEAPGGILHMAGNVAEWVDTAPEGQPDRRMLKGGSYKTFKVEDLAVQARAVADAGDREPGYGFRVVLEAGE